MSEMKTRVAIALGERLKTAFNGKPATMHELAEIALKAMREPTEEMLDCPAYTAALQTIRANAVAAGFSGRFFVNKETWVGGSVIAAVQSAQTGIVDSTTFWAGADMDSLNATNRGADNTHLNDTGAAAAATLIYNAMHASGAPY